MARKRNPEKEAFWRDILDRQAASRLSIREFCERERISEPSFFGWRRKLQGRPAPRQRENSEFIPLTLIESSNVLEVIHPLGYRIRVTGEVDASVLGHVLDVIDGRGNQ